ncbi:hypothetical protein PUN28_007390 [Cardiocondyla obscurior]|uniref:Uncharacterized protein n=1 Tax=Cardiocondyla obscurior TaxID=286306 RepID=A0AAW2G8U7_9HYME
MTAMFTVTPRVEISAGYSGRRRNLEIINSSGIYEKRLKPAHIVTDNSDDRGENRRGEKREEKRPREREKLLSRLSRRYATFMVDISSRHFHGQLFEIDFYVIKQIQFCIVPSYISYLHLLD